MRKKVFSALLFGTLAVVSTGSLVSCKDYDDDISNLQEKVDASGVDVTSEISRLEGLLDNCKSASEKADQELNEAIKAATNDAKGYADIQAAEAKKAAIEASQALIEKAISDLENGNLKAAKAKADEAYVLAEQVQKLAEANQKDIEKLVKDLDTTTKNLEAADKALEEKLEGTQKDLEAAKKDIEKNGADIVTINEALKSLEESNDKAHKALSDKDDELKKLIEANQAAIKDIIDNKLTKLEADYQAAVKALEDGAVKDNADAIKALKDGAVKNNTDAIKNLKDVDIKNINTYLNSLAFNLNNLITGLILQDEQLEIVQAQVLSDVNKTGLTGKVFTKVDAEGLTHVIFPYKGAAGADENTLVVGQWNVERVAGPVYYTINPTNVNFTDKANIQLENSLGKTPEGLTISTPEASTRKSAITSRAGSAPKNGLYQSVITNSNNHLSRQKHAGFENSYALYTSYKQKAKDGSFEPDDKKVYSKYELNINVIDAVAQTAPSIVATGADTGTHPSTCDARYTVNYGEQMTGKFNLLPQNTEFGKSATASPKVYRKYVEAVAVSNARNEAQTGNTLTSLLKAINDANKGVLNTIFEEDNENFDNIVVNIPDASGNYSFVGSTVTFRYYIQNYNGTIYSKDIKVMFAKTLFNEDGMDIVHTPYASGINTTLHNLNADSKTDFQLEANCIKVDDSNKLWYKNTNKIEVEATDGLKLKKVEFYTGTKTPNWTASTAVATINMNGNASASVSGLGATALQSIKNMILVYDPADVEVEKVYNLVMRSYDLNGNTVSVLPIKFTMKYPNHHAELIKPNPAFFTPFDANMNDAKALKGKLLTAWANYHKATATAGVYNATYNVIAAFNKPYFDEEHNDGCVISFDYTDKADYISTPSHVAKYAKYLPVNTWRLNYVSAATDYIMEVPSAAVKYGKEHEYTLQVAVENFGVKSLWYAPTDFKVVFKSAIAWADFKFKQDAYEVEYPNHSITITENQISADDPSTSSADKINYFGTAMDSRIKETKVKLLDTQFASLFKSVTVEPNGIKVVTNEDVPGGVGSITSSKIKFGFYVTDFYGNTKEYVFYVKVKENK